MYRSRWYSIDQPEGDRRAPSAQCRRGLPRHARTHAPDQGEFRTITADNGTEFHGYAQIELKSEVQFYFATPHHSWERGTNENTNGLIRQYLPKGQSMGIDRLRFSGPLEVRGWAG